MKFTGSRLQVGLALFLFSLAYPLSTASAHLAGQPPFFIINNFYSNLYPVPLTSLSNFPLPQDMAPKTYTVGQELDMKLDEKVLPAPPEVIEKTTFTWDFDDGTKGTGLSNKHVYKKMGSYILKIYADDGTVPTPQLLESALINVAPSANYKLPQAVIKVDGQESKDPLTDVLHFPLDSNLNFDATTSSTDPSSKIVSYFWDFGDQKSGTTPTAQHSYPKDQTQIFVVLRVTDKNGFIADNFVELENGKFVAGNSSNNSNNPAQVAAGASSKSKLGYALGGLGVLGLLGIIYFMVRRSARDRGHGRRL